MIISLLDLSLLVVALVTVVHTADRGCEEQELAKCGADQSQQTISGTSNLLNIFNKKELDFLCPDLLTGLRCIDSYIDRCFSSKQRAIFGRRSSSSMVRDLCTEGDYQIRFLRHTPCMESVKPQYARCRWPNRQDTLMENTTKSQQREKLNLLCCSFDTYVECTERAVRVQCGDDSADFSREFISKIGDSLIDRYCGEDPEYSERCVNFYNTALLGSAPSLLMLSLLVLALMLRVY